MRHIRNTRQHLFKAGIGGFHVLSQFGDAVAHFARTLLRRRGIHAFFTKFCNLARHRVLFRPQLFGFRDRGAAALIESMKFVERKRKTARGKTGGKRLRIGAKCAQIVHIDVC